MTEKKAQVDKIQLSESFPGGELVLHNGYNFPGRNKETGELTGELVQMDPAIKLYTTVQGKVTVVDFTKIDPQALLAAYKKLIAKPKAADILREIADTR